MLSGVAGAGLVGFLVCASSVIGPGAEGTAVPSDPVPGATVIINPGPGAAAPTYFSGTLVGLQGETLVIATDGGDRAVRVASGAHIWRGGVVSLTDLEPGDRLSVSGAADKQGQFVASTVEANIVQVRGTVLDATAEGWFVLDERFGRMWLVTIDGANPPEPLFTAPGQADSNDPSLLQPGKFVSVIGLQTGDGVMVATKLSSVAK
ncbi:MAG: hypothetical protein Kow0010_05360 [Dehalococcoidia bacterium]